MKVTSAPQTNPVCIAHMSKQTSCTCALSQGQGCCTCHLWVVVKERLNKESHKVEVGIEHRKSFEVKYPHDCVNALRPCSYCLLNEVCAEFLTLSLCELAYHMPACDTGGGGGSGQPIKCLLVR